MQLWRGFITNIDNGYVTAQIRNADENHTVFISVDDIEAGDRSSIAAGGKILWAVNPCLVCQDGDYYIPLSVANAYSLLVCKWP